MAPNRLILLCLIVNLCFASCLTATLNPKNVWPVNSNSPDPLKSSDEKATTSQTGIDQDATIGLKSETTRYSTEVPSKLKSELSTDSTIKPVRFRIPLNADTKLDDEKKLEKLGVTVETGTIKKDEVKPSSPPLVFDPFHLIQAEQNMMMKTLAQIPLVFKSKEENSKPEGTTHSNQYSKSTLKVSDERVSEAPLGFLSLYDATPKRKLSTLEKVSSGVHNLGVSGNSSMIFASSQTILSPRFKPLTSEGLKVDSATSNNLFTTVNLKPTKEPKFMQLQESPKGLSATPSGKLQVRSGIVDETTLEPLGISQNPTQVPLGESTTNRIQLKLIPLENRNKDALTSGGKKDGINVLEALKSVPTPEPVRTPTAAFDTGKTDDVIDVGGMIPKGTMLSLINSPSDKKGTIGSHQDASVASSMIFTLPGTIYRDNNRGSNQVTNLGSKPGPKGDLEIKEVSILSSGGITKVEDVTKSIPVVSAASSSSTPSLDMKYRDNVNTKYSSKEKIETIGDAVFDPEQITDFPIIYYPLLINTQLKGISNRSTEKVDAKIANKLFTTGGLETKSIGGQIFENKVDDIGRNSKDLLLSSTASTHFPDIYYSSNGNIIDGKLNREVLKIVGEFDSKKLTSETKSEGVTRNILDVSTGIFASTRQPDDKIVVRKSKEQVASRSAMRLTGSKIDGVTKEASAVSIEPLTSTPLPDTHYRRIDNVGLKMNADSKVSSKGESKVESSSGFLLEKIPESKMGDAAVITTSEGPKGSVEAKGEMTRQPKVAQL